MITCAATHIFTMKLKNRQAQFTALRQWSPQMTAMMTQISHQVQSFRDALGIAVSRADQASDCVVQTRKDTEHGGLAAADKDEDVWAFNNGKKSSQAYHTWQ
jgi:hypothetical protein